MKVREMQRVSLPKCGYHNEFRNQADWRACIARNGLSRAGNSRPRGCGSFAPLCCAQDDPLGLTRQSAQSSSSVRSTWLVIPTLSAAHSVIPSRSEAKARNPHLKPRIPRPSASVRAWLRLGADSSLRSERRGRSVTPTASVTHPVIPIPERGSTCHSDPERSEGEESAPPGHADGVFASAWLCPGLSWAAPRTDPRRTGQREDPARTSMRRGHAQRVTLALPLHGCR